MTIGTVADDLKYGELRNLPFKDDYPTIVAYINQALVALYERFKLKTGEQLIPLEDSIVDYSLNDDCMTIEAVYDENGDEFAMNDETSLFSIFQVAFDTIQVPNPQTGATLGVLYIQAPNRLTYIDEGSLDTKIPLPPQLNEPLLHYIGFKAHSSIDGGVEGANNPYYARYEASCNRIERTGSIRIDTVPAQVSLKESISDTAKTYQIKDLNT